jgi:hypothetical protein
MDNSSEKSSQPILLSARLCISLLIGGSHLKVAAIIVTTFGVNDHQRNRPFEDALILELDMNVSTEVLQIS